MVGLRARQLSQTEAETIFFANQPNTESNEIDREGQKWLAPRLGHIGYHLIAYINRSGVIYQIFKFQPRAREMGPQSSTPQRQEKKFPFFDYF